MSIWQVLGFIGFGTVIGSTIQVFFNSRMQNKKLIFEARVKAYNGLIGLLYNEFFPEKWNMDQKDLELEINKILSEPLLLGSHELVSLLVNFKNDFLYYLSTLKDEPVPELEVLEKAIGEFGEHNYINKIHVQMRKDLYFK